MSAKAASAKMARTKAASAEAARPEAASAEMARTKAASTKVVNAEITNAEAASAASYNKILTIPNLLTLLRFLLLPIYFILFVVYHNDVAAFIVFMVAASTDFFDGAVARRLGQVSRIGKEFDPLVDRLLIVVGIVGVFVVKRVPLWFLAILLTRDAVMLFLTIYQKLRFNKAFEVVFLGKLATAFAMAGFCSLILGHPRVPGLGLINTSWLPGWGQEATQLGTWLLYLGMIFSLITAGIYLGRGVAYTREHARGCAQEEWDTQGARDARQQDTRQQELSADMSLGADFSAEAPSGNASGEAFSRRNLSEENPSEESLPE